MLVRVRVVHVRPRHLRFAELHQGYRYGRGRVDDHDLLLFLRQRGFVPAHERLHHVALSLRRARQGEHVRGLGQKRLHRRVDAKHDVVLRVVVVLVRHRLHEALLRVEVRLAVLVRGDVGPLELLRASAVVRHHELSRERSVFKLRAHAHAVVDVHVVARRQRPGAHRAQRDREVLPFDDHDV